MLCEEWTLAKREGRQVTYMPLRCGRWECELCQPKRKWQLVQKAVEGEPNTLITLTIRSGVFDDPNAGAQALVRAWRTILRRAKHTYEYDRLPFLAIFEATKRGEPHLHILARVPWLDQDWLSAQCEELLSSPVVDIRRVRRRDKTARYVSKYVGKAPHRFTGTKRYWCSQDYNAKNNQEDETDDTTECQWFVIRRDFRDLLEEAWNYAIVIRHTEDSFTVVEEDPTLQERPPP